VVDYDGIGFAALVHGTVFDVKVWHAPKSSLYCNFFAVNGVGKTTTVLYSTGDSIKNTIPSAKLAANTPTCFHCIFIQDIKVRRRLEKMLLTLRPEQFMLHFVHFVPPVKNIIIPKSVFSCIVYSAPTFSTRGIFLQLQPHDHVGAIEQAILQAYSTCKRKVFSLNRELRTSFVLKISGIWETDENCGVAYRFIPVD